MALQHLTDEQVRTWSLEQKDRWWLANVYRGDMPQLTFRSALTGFILGGLLSATNLYVGAKTGWTLGVGLTSVILAFAMFKILSRMGARDFTILENNAMQSIATSAGYMTSPLVAGFAAYMWIENRIVDGWHIFWFMVVLSVLGVLVAFPLKRRFINDEQQPFPEGRACGVVLDTLYTSDARSGLFQAKVLAMAAGFAGLISFIAGEAYLKAIHGLILMLRTGQSWADTLAANKDKLNATWHLPHSLDGWYYSLAAKMGWPTPKLAGVELRQLGVSPALDLAMVGAGGLMGARPALNMLLGMAINFLIIVPWMIHEGEILPRTAEMLAANPKLKPIDRVWILNSWALWWGVSIMVVASLVAMFAKPKLLISAFTGIFKKRAASADVLGHIELPTWVSFVGVPIFGAIGVWMAHDWFGVDWYLGALAIPLIIVLTLIAVNSTALTGITPTGSLSKIPQFIFGVMRPKHPATNLMTAVMCVEVAGNASNLLMDIKPGYMLGAKPRQQAIGHCIGIIAGALAAVPLFHLLFLSEFKPGDPGEAGNLREVMVSDQFGFPSAFQWFGISELISNGFGSLKPSIQWSMGIAAAAGLVFEVARILTRNKFPLSPLAIGLGVVVPPESTIAMCFGALLFWGMGKLYAGKGAVGAGAEHGGVAGELGTPVNAKPLSIGHRIWIGAQEPICAGLIAGAALVGIGDILVRVFVLK
ncbi:MAG TPA: OPT/YSL family transporter [Phycisphaerales bacterium]|nr:OPT/YSL family transporter [Phycisphaerales bacterium]